MKILKLRFKNINSLKGEHEIDFTASPLADSGIFAIVGPTGAGKSTLLDVITLALFNKTPRIGNLSKSTIESYGAIITRNTDEAFAEIDYESSGLVFRSKWTIKKARTGSMRDYEMELFSISEDKFIDVKRSEVPDRNAEYIGLSYEQFLKSIILSQGDFARFIKESPNERANLLEKITGTEIYRDLGKAAYERFKVEKQNLDVLSLKLDSIRVLTEDERVHLQQQIDALNITLADMLLKESEFTKLSQIKLELQKLEEEQNANHLLLSENQTAFERAQPSFNRLLEHDRLLPIKPEIDKWQSIVQSIKDTQNQLSEKQKQLENLNFQHLQSSKQLEAVISKRTELEQNIARFEPLIEEAVRLDMEVVHASKQLQEHSLAAKSSREKLAKLLEEINQITAAYQTNNGKLASARNWKSENEVLSSASLDSNLIKDSYKSFLFKARQNCIIKPDEHLPCSIEFSEQLQKKHSSLSIEAQNFDSEIKLLSEDCEYSPEDLFVLNQKIISYAEKINQLNKQLELSNLYTNVNKKNGELNIFINDLQNQEKTVLFELIEQKNKIEDLLNCRTELLILLERQQLEAKYEQDRSSLLKGEACYLCGSTDHPYVQEYKSVLNDTKIELDHCDQLIDKYRKLIHQNEIDVNSYELKIKEHKASLEENIRSITLFISNFSELNSKLEVDFEISNYTKIKQYIEGQNSDKKELEDTVKKLDKISLLGKKKSDVMRQVDSISESIGEIQRLLVYIDRYSPSLKLPLEFNFDIFIEELDKSIKHYKIAEDRINTLEKEIEVQRSSIEQKKQNHLDVVAEANQRTDVEAKHTLNLNELRATRKALGVDDPQGLRTRFQNEQKTLLSQLSAIEKTIDQNRGEFNILTQIIESYKVQLNQLIVSESDINVIIFEKIQPLGYKTISDCLVNILQDEVVNKIKKELDRLQNNLSILNQNKERLDSKIKDISILDNNKYTKLELEQLLSNVKLVQKENNQLIGEYTGKLQEDGKKRSEALSVMEQLDAQNKILEKWSKLKDLIGDATGQKFSKFAQDLSLTVLIELANQHLIKFTDRYYIVKKDVDDLIIVDTYLADSERSVKTLSGGETFLVSLALSLGLSDLASSNAKLGCLFIDEGFGTLDAASLDIALDALEKLQVESQRVIGIISHVQALKDRINTQIELVKLSGGYSKIYIHD